MLDGRGTAVAVNPISSTFELADSLGVTVANDRAVNYFEVCRTAAAAGSIEAAAMAVGLDAVCRGTSSYAEFDIGPPAAAATAGWSSPSRRAVTPNPAPSSSTAISPTESARKRRSARSVPASSPRKRTNAGGLRASCTTT